MKATVNEKEAKKREYPMLKCSGGCVVLFTAPKTGTFVGFYGGYSLDYKIGDYRTDWIDREFVPFTGTVTLEND